MKWEVSLPCVSTLETGSSEHEADMAFLSMLFCPGVVCQCCSMHHMKLRWWHLCCLNSVIPAHDQTEELKCMGHGMVLQSNLGTSLLAIPRNLISRTSEADFGLMSAFTYDSWSASSARGEGQARQTRVTAGPRNS